MTQLPAAFLHAPIAHRAYHDRAAGRPENSRAAIRAAVAAGYGIEIDVQPSSDGVAMVFHDHVLDRLTDESDPINARSAEALGAIRLKDAEDGIPTLAEVLKIVGGAVPLLVEIKDQDGALGPDVGPLEEAVAADIAGYNGPIAVMSFNPHSMIRMAILSEDVPRGLTTCAFPDSYFGKLPAGQLDALRAISQYEAARCCFVSHEWGDLANPRVAELKADGAAILSWTIRSAAEESQAREIAQNVTFEGYAA